ncbi:hypothetical protein [Blastococcus sp. SYSU D00695]
MRTLSAPVNNSDHTPANAPVSSSDCASNRAASGSVQPRTTANSATNSSAGATAPTRPAARSPPTPRRRASSATVAVCTANSLAIRASVDQMSATRSTSPTAADTTSDGSTGTATPLPAAVVMTRTLGRRYDSSASFDGA